MIQFAAIRSRSALLSLTILAVAAANSFAQTPSTAAPAAAVKLGPYEYQVKPDDEAFGKLNPRKAPPVGPLLLEQGDRLAICGDSITEQKMYSRIIETYLTACTPQLEITARQYGWSGEKTDGFLGRMDNDCLRFEPTIATLCYGMNDARYRPFDVTNGQWYEDHYRAIVRKFKDAGVRVAARLARLRGEDRFLGREPQWDARRAEREPLCATRHCNRSGASPRTSRSPTSSGRCSKPKCLDPASTVRRPTSRTRSPAKTASIPVGQGTSIMAYAFLRAMGLDGQIADLSIDMSD